jgi:hypothetical protein
LIEAQIRAIQGHKEKLQQQVDALEVEAANLERIGKPAPASLTDTTETLRQDIDGDQGKIADLKEEQRRIREHFEGEIQRFRELNTTEATTSAE